MPNPIETLRECHRLRRHAAALRGELQRLPKQVKAHQARVISAEKGFHDAQEGLKKLKVTISTSEKTLKETHQLIDKYKRQLNEASATKEFEALRHEISGAQEKCQKLEDEILEQISRSEEQTAQLPEIEKGVKRTKDEVAQFEKEAGARRQRMEEELARAQQSLKDAEATLPGDMGEQYRRLVAAKGDDALSVLREKTCTACYTAITAQNYNDLTQGKLVICKACGRMLYLPE